MNNEVGLGWPKLGGQPSRKHLPYSSGDDRSRRLKEHGWSESAFAAKYEEQRGLCAICGKLLHTERRLDGSKACADHEHTRPPKPRGLLCINCNAGIGNFKDNPQFLLQAAAYVLKYRQ